MSLICSTSHASESARSDGALVAQSWKPDRLTPSSSHIRETGKLALSAEMIRYTLTGSRSPSRRRPRLA